MTGSSCGVLDHNKDGSVGLKTYDTMTKTASSDASVGKQAASSDDDDHDLHGDRDRNRDDQSIHCLPRLVIDRHRPLGLANWFLDLH